MIARFRLISVAVVFTLAAVTQAQFGSPDSPTQTTISYGTSLMDSITDEAVFDLFEFTALQGERIRAVMVGRDGLAPLLGIRGVSGEILARSDVTADGTPVDAPPDGVATLEFEIPEDGTYIIVPTRAGTADGTTTGVYSLTLGLVSDEAPATRTNSYQPVRFRCDNTDYVTAMSMIIGEDTDKTTRFEITVFGLSGFTPAIRRGNDEFASCLAGNVIENASIITIPEQVSTVTSVTRYEFETREGPVLISLGTSTAGGYLIHIAGFGIDEAGDREGMFVGQGPLNTDTPIDFYMLRTDSRIDPQVEIAIPPDTILNCDDAGRRDCADMPAASGFEIIIGEAQTVRGDRLDAGGRIATGQPDPVAITLSSSNRASGKFSMIFLGQMPQLP